MQKILAVITSAALFASGCASAGGRLSTPRPDPALLASYVKQLQVGSRVRVDLVDGRVVKGTLMKTSDTAIVVQRRTRIAEAPDEFALGQVAAVQVEPASGGPGKAIAIGAAAGAAAALGVFLIIVAIFAGD